MARATYLVKEIFGPTVQGEGYHAGRACVFLRFAACNLACSFCDTDFRPEGAEKLTADEIVTRLSDRDTSGSRRVIVTGGEPALQWDAALADALRTAGFIAHMESNGTRPLAAPVDWLTLSPKPQFHPPGEALDTELQPSEVKVVVDETVTDETLATYERHWDCDNLFLQPCWGPTYDDSLKRTLELVQRRPWWRLSLQIHKLVGVP